MAAPTMDALTTLLVEHLGVQPGAVTPEARLAEDLQADSLDQIELVMACEEAFGIEIDDAQAEAVHTVGEMLALLQAAVAARNVAA